MTIEELFGTLQMSVVAGWRKHLRTAKYAKHEALDEFYKEMPEKVDALIEAWMGAHGKKVGAFQNVLSSSNMNTLKYLGELKRVCKEGYALMGDKEELKSLVDDIVNLINSTLYKVKELSENKNNFIDLKDYINESLINEGIDNKFIKLLGNMYNDYGDLSPISDCFHWLDELDWKVMKEIKYAEAVNDINDSVEVEYALDYYAPVMLAMAKAGKKDTITAISKITDKSEMEDFDINESLVVEAVDNSKEWDAVLKELSSQRDYANYTQLSGLENLGEYADDDEALAVELESWMSEYDNKIVKIEKKLKKIDVRNVLTEIAHFIANSYERSLMHYGDDRQEIAEIKHEYVFVNNATDFGVEEEDYWTYYEYTGDNKGKKYASIIAQYADCSEDYDPDDLEGGEDW